VTGAGRGIGAAIARELARDGCDVALVDKATAPAETVAGEIRRLGRRAVVLDADVTSLTAAGASVGAVLAELGRLDLLVCNAGISRDAVVWKLPIEEWDVVQEVNLRGAFLLLRQVIPVMRRGGSGRPRGGAPRSAPGDPPFRRHPDAASAAHLPASADAPGDRPSAGAGDPRRRARRGW